VVIPEAEGVCTPINYTKAFPGEGAATVPCLAPTSAENCDFAGPHPAAVRKSVGGFCAISGPSQENKQSNIGNMNFFMIDSHCFLCVFECVC
jgi:hypothetical protein